MHITLPPSPPPLPPSRPVQRLLIPTTDFSSLSRLFSLPLKYFKSIQWQKRLLYLLPLRMRAGLIRCQWTANWWRRGRPEGAARWAALQRRRMGGSNGSGLLVAHRRRRCPTPRGSRKDVDDVAISHWYFGIWALSGQGTRGSEGSSWGVALRGGWNLIRLRWARSIVFALSVTSPRNRNRNGMEWNGCGIAMGGHWELGWRVRDVDTRGWQGA